MDAFHAVKVGILGCGLTSQIGFIISGIMQAKLLGKRYVVLDNFNKQFDTVSPVPVCDIIDFDVLNNYLMRHGLQVLDQTKSNVRLISARYGSFRHNCDITQALLQLCPDGVIPKTIALNDLCGDPAPGIRKNLFLKISIDSRIDTIMCDEYRPFDIDFDLKKLVPVETGSWLTTFDIDLYKDILHHISFSGFLPNVSVPFSKINVLHLRDDEDALVFWSQTNNMSVPEYSRHLISKYCQLIKEHLDPKDALIVVTNNLKSPVLDYLYQRNYHYYTSKKMYPERELNAIVDLLNGTQCNNIFIGNYNINTHAGSSFSYILANQLPDSVKKIMIDLDNIKDEPTIY